MKITFKNFIITPSIGLHKFDLSKIAIIQKGKKEGQEIERSLAYGITLRRAFVIILDELTVEEHDEAYVTFEEYLKTYERIGNDLKQEVQRIEVSLSK